MYYDISIGSNYKKKTEGKEWKVDSCETETDGYAGRDVGDSVGGAVDHVGGPRLVVVAAAVGRTRHLAVAGVELAAVAQGEAVRPVRTQEIRRRCFHLAEQHHNFI